MRRYWFPAKRYGWGWGVPATWEGWLVLLGYFGALAWGAAHYLPQRENDGFLLFTFAVTVALVLVCYLTGEPPRWRWGK